MMQYGYAEDHSPIGRLFLAYVAEGEAYNPAVHAREDENLKGVKLSFKENMWWTAEITVVGLNRGPARPGQQQRVFISVEYNDEVVPFFVGRIRSWPSGSPTSEMVIQASGVPLNLEAVKAAATAGIDPDIYGILAPDKSPERKLSTGLDLIHLSRFDRPARVVSLVTGDRIVDVADNYILDTLSYSEPNDPITSIDVDITAEFRQTELHEIELGYGRDMFAPGIGDDGIFGTLLWPDWNTSFFRRGDRIGDWNVVDAGIRPAPSLPPEAGGSDRSPAFLADVRTNRDMDVGRKEGTVSLRYVRNFVQARLRVVSTRTIRRVEKLAFRLEWRGQPFAPFTGKNESLSLKLNNLQLDPNTVPEWQPNTYYPENAKFTYDDLIWLWNEAGDTSDEFYKDYDRMTPQPIDFSPMRGPSFAIFFGQPNVVSGVNTPNGGSLIIGYDPTPGETALAYAYGQAQSKMLLNSRHGVRFDVPLEFVINCEGSEVIRISGQDVLGGEAYGKITEMTMTIDQEGARAQVAIGCIPGTGINPVAPRIPLYLPAPVPPAGVVSADVENEFVEQEFKLSQVQWPALNPNQPERVGELSGGNTRPDPSPKGYDLSSYLEGDGMKTSFDIVMTPMRGQLDRGVLIVPTNGNNGVFYVTGPKNIDLSGE